MWAPDRSPVVTGLGPDEWPMVGNSYEVVTEIVQQNPLFTAARFMGGMVIASYSKHVLAQPSGATTHNVVQSSDQLRRLGARVSRRPSQIPTPTESLRLEECRDPAGLRVSTLQ